MALPTKLNAADVKGWARKRMALAKKSAVRAAGKVPGKAKAPAEDPKKTAPKAPNAPVEGDEAGEEKGLPSEKISGKPNTEPQDPMNKGGPDVPEEFLDDLRTDEDDEEYAPGAESVAGNPDLEAKLGEFAEVLEHRAAELEELAAEVQGDLTGDEVDLETMREVQSLIPDELRQDLVEHVSSLTDDEIGEFCLHLAEQGSIEDAELMANFLRAAAADSSEEDDEDGEELPEDEEAEDENGEEEALEDEDAEDPELPEDEDEEDEEEEEPPRKGKPKFKPKRGKKKPPPFAK